MSNVRVFDLTRQDTDDLRERLMDIAELVRRIPAPNSHRPEVFTEAKSELANEIEIVAKSLAHR